MYETLMHRTPTTGRQQRGPLLQEMVDRYLQLTDRVVRRSSDSRSTRGQETRTNRGNRDSAGPLLQLPIQASVRAAKDAVFPASQPADVAPAWRNRGRWDKETIELRSSNAMRIFDMLLRDGLAPALAAAWAANAEAESGSGEQMVQGVRGGGEGIFQWDRRRRANFPRAFGRSYEQSTIRDQLAFPRWEFANDPYERQYSAPRIRKAEATADPGIIAATISRYYLRPREQDRDAADRANLADAILRRWRSRGPQGWWTAGPERQ